MKSKFLVVTDTYTRIHVLVLQFEAADKAFAEPARFGPGLKVVLHFDGRRVSCIAGYDLRDELDGTIETLSTPFPRDGTVTALKEILHNVDDIRKLPDVVDVEAFRRAWAMLRRRTFVHTGVRAILEERDHEVLRKVLYRWGAMAHLAIVDIERREVLFDQGTTALDWMVAEYLWIPIEEAQENELSGLDLCPFRYELL
jgi:hypothetical protein